jgi:hypothetical protein
LYPLDKIYFSTGNLQMTTFIIHNDRGHSILSVYASILLMLWIILLIILLPVAWILLAPFQFEIDTRVPVIMVQWKSIGNATLFYEDEVWWLQIRVWFFSKKWNLVQMIFAGRKKKKKVVQSRKRKSGRKYMPFIKFFKILKTFQIVHWEIAFSADDYTKNARWYWLNFLAVTRKHVYINFDDKNYLVLVIRNKAWRIAHAFMK